MSVQIHRGWEVATDAILEALHTHFDDELVNLWGVEDHVDDLGLFLPGIDGDIRLEISPDINDLARLKRPVLMMGPAGGVEATDNYFITGQGDAYTARLPFAAALYFPHAQQKAVADPITGRPMRDRDIMIRRAQRYAGTLAHTIGKHVVRDVEGVSHIEPVDSQVNGAVELQGSKARIGVGLYFFTAQQEQVTPAPA